MILQDSLGQTTNIKFSNVKLNTTIPASTFNFTPPKAQTLLINKHQDQLNKKQSSGCFLFLIEMDLESLQGWRISRSSGVLE